MISAYSTIVARRQFQRIIFNDQVLFGLFDPLLQPQNIAIAVVHHEVVGPVTGFLTLFLFITNLVAMCLILFLAVWQMSLITKGQTCVEEKIDKSMINNSVIRRPYDLGWRQNWRTFFEINSTNELLVRLLVPFLFQPKHDGTRWISKNN